MQKRCLGSSDLEISTLGFGTWGLGGDSYGPTDDNESERTLLRAYELGVNFYDTADLYGNGHSEELIASALKGKREKIVIATKGGTLPHTTFDMPQDFTVKHMRRAFEASLSRLDTDYIDLYQLHSPTLEDIRKNEDVIELLESLKDEGHIKAWGVSARSPQDALVFARDYGASILQVNFNLIDQRAIDSGLFDYAEKNGVGIIARTPLCFGYLSGKMTGREEFKGQDHRSNWPREQLTRWADSPGLFDELKNRKHMSSVALALNYCLHPSCVATVIPGMMSVAEVEENVSSVSPGILTQSDLEEIRHIYENNSFYDKTIKQKVIESGKNDRAA